jgi:5'-nucleotidase
MGREHYWFTVIPLEETEEGTDRYAMHQGLVSITPLRLDLTNEKALSKVLAKHSGVKLSV